MDATGFVLIALTLSLLGLFTLWMYRRMQHTSILQTPGGLRFEAYDFSVQVQRLEQQIHVCCARGVLGTPAAPLTPEAVPGPVEHRFAAPGLDVEWREELHPGYTDVLLKGADGTQLRIARISAPVAARFKYFYLQVRLWIDKLELRLERERIEGLRAEELAAQQQRDADLLVQLNAGKPAQAALTDEEREAMAQAQIAQWRAAAGFTGQNSLSQTDTKGRVLWFVDLADDGRITLHSDKRTVHSTLRGARIEAVFGELEVSVRDAYWSEEHPELCSLRVLKGRSAAERLAWRERLEILRNTLDRQALSELAPSL